MLPYLNVGCGNRFHPEWYNVDMSAKSRDVQVADLTKGIPFPDNTFEVVYHAHVLEHIPIEAAAFFIKECCRVLKPGGVLRVVIPDLEGTMRHYLQNLEGALQGDASAQRNYEWIMTEMYDQSVRSKPGGQMVDILGRKDLPQEPYILSRIGLEARQIREKILHPAPGSNTFSAKWKAFMKWDFRNRMAFIRRTIVSALLFGEAKQFYKAGRFLHSGELHKWMYDRYSLNKLLREQGFSSAQIQTATESLVPDWGRFGLDVVDGEQIRPNSLYMEAIK